MSQCWWRALSLSLGCRGGGGEGMTTPRASLSLTPRERTQQETSISPREGNLEKFSLLLPQRTVSHLSPTFPTTRLTPPKPNQGRILQFAQRLSLKQHNLSIQIYTLALWMDGVGYHEMVMLEARFRAIIYSFFTRIW